MSDPLRAVLMTEFELEAAACALRAWVEEGQYCACRYGCGREDAPIGPDAAEYLADKLQQESFVMAEASKGV